MRFHLSEKFTEGYYLSLTTPLPSEHKYRISLDHYRQIAIGLVLQRRVLLKLWEEKSI